MIQSIFANKSFLAGFKVECKKEFITKKITDFYIDYKGIIRESVGCCPTCKSELVTLNGYTEYPNKVFTAMNLDIKKGQYMCGCCGQGWIVEPKPLVNISEEFNRTLRPLIISLRIKELSFPKIAEVLNEAFHYKVSEEKIRQIYNETKQKIRDLTVYTKQSGYYLYDAQHLKISGRKHYRHMIKDAINGKVLVDVVLPKQNKETLKHLFLKYIQCEHIIAFTVDMATPYPNILKECFGNNIKIQWCWFHLHQDLRRKFNVGKKIVDDSGFQAELQKQSIFDIAYPRKEIIEFLNKALLFFPEAIKRLQKNGYDEKEIFKFMKQIRKNFWKLYSKLQKRRRANERKKSSLIKYENILKQRFDNIFKMINTFPTKIKKVLNKMKKKWNMFVEFCRDENIHATNNQCENYFSITCQKTQKKKFRSVDAARLKCKISFLLQNDVKPYIPKSIFDFVCKYSLFFEKCKAG